MKFKVLIFALAFAGVLNFVGCTKTELVKNVAQREINLSDETGHTKSLFAMDTSIDLKIYGDEAVLDKAEEEINRIESLLSKTKSESEIYALNNKTSDTVSTETEKLLNTALKLGEETNGAFDITIAPVVELWGFPDKNFRVPETEELNKALESVDYKNITLENGKVNIKNNSQIDLGGIAKGFTSDSLMKLFAENGIKSGLVSLGGNVQAIGTKPNGDMWNVAIQNPFDESGESYIGAVKIADKAVITSGGYQRYFVYDDVKYHHIINPETGYPADSGLVSVTIVSENGTLADGLSTSLYVMGLEKSIELWKTHNDFDVVFVTENNEIYITDGIKDYFTSNYPYEVINR
jgi:thiamine biosynthesis lipoprotein